MTPFWRFNAKTETEAELYLYGDISDVSWFGDEVTPKAFADQLKNLGDVSQITARINSAGGDVFAGQTIYNLLRSHKANVTVHIDGLAASIASIIAMAGDTVIMPANAMMMIHSPWSYAAGNANDFRQMAETLDTVRESLIAVYQARTDMDRETLVGLLDAETWMTAQEAKDLGFADEIEDLVKVAASARAGVYTVNGHELDFKGFKVWPGALLRSADHEDSCPAYTTGANLIVLTNQPSGAVDAEPITNAGAAARARRLELIDKQIKREELI
jgi:ATP-dependent Clp protease protease subunit